MGLDPDREVFAHAPVRYVVVDVQFTDEPDFGGEAARDAVRGELRGEFPLFERLTLQTLQFGPAGTRQLESGGWRFRNAAKTAAVNVTPSAIAFDTTTYRRFEDVLDTLAAVVPIVTRSGTPDVVRVGVRYVNEIRVGGDRDGVGRWDGWISESLLVAERALARDGGRVLGTFERTDDDGSAVRMAWAHGRGWVVAPEGSLVVPDPPAPDSPYFVIDIDAYRAFSARTQFPLSWSALAPSLERLHDAAEPLFRAAITDKLVDTYFRKAT